MRYYETLYIVNPNFEQNRLDEVIQNVTKESRKHHLVTINHRVWGKKRLAYPIDNHKYGTYVLFQFETEENSAIRELDNFLKLHQAVIRSQTIRLERRPDKVETLTGQEEKVERGVKKKPSGGKSAAQGESPPESGEEQGKSTGKRTDREGKN